MMTRPRSLRDRWSFGRVLGEEAARERLRQNGPRHDVRDALPEQKARLGPCVVTPLPFANCAPLVIVMLAFHRSRKPIVGVGGGGA